MIATEAPPPSPVSSSCYPSWLMFWSGGFLNKKIPADDWSETSELISLESTKKKSLILSPAAGVFPSNCLWFTQSRSRASCCRFKRCVLQVKSRREKANRSPSPSINLCQPAASTQLQQDGGSGVKMWKWKRESISDADAVVKVVSELETRGCK